MFSVTRRFALGFVALTGTAVLAPAVLSAADVSLVSGLYKSEEWKSGGNDAGGKSEISLGGRYHEDLSTNVAWFAQGGLMIKSYESGQGGSAPDNATGISLGGGMRMYFSPFGHSVVPYVAGSGRYMNDKDTTYDGGAGGFREVESSGLYYSGAIGIRVGMNEDFFLEIESAIFDSALYANEKTERTTVTTGAGGTTVTTSEDETTRMELFASSGGAQLGNAVFALGMKL